MSAYVDRIDEESFDVKLEGMKKPLLKVDEKGTGYLAEWQAEYRSQQFDELVKEYAGNEFYDLDITEQREVSGDSVFQRDADEIEKITAEGNGYRISRFSNGGLELEVHENMVQDSPFQPFQFCFQRSTTQVLEESLQNEVLERTAEELGYADV